MIDARGESCPIPVVMVQKEVKNSNPSELQVLVDSMVCVENISRYANLITPKAGLWELEELNNP